jgi:outer membrane lipoprotein-sorting protein
MVWLLVPFLFFPAAAQAQPKAGDVLRRVKETYAAAKQYQFTGRVVERSAGVETTGSDEIAVDKRGRVWFKAVGSLAVAESGGREGETLIAVADGKDVWIYLEQQKLFKKAKGIPESRNKDDDDEAMDNPRAFARKLMDSQLVRYAQLARRSSNAKVVREESCSANGLTTDCYVIEIPAESLDPDVTATYTLWVDKRRYLVLRDDYRIVDKGKDTYANSIVYDVAEITVEIPDKLFTFTPPPDAKEVDSFYR